MKVLKKHALYIQKVNQQKFLWDSDTEDVIDKLFNTFLQKFQRAQETSNERGNEVIPDSVEYKEQTLKELNHT